MLRATFEVRINEEYGTKGLWYVGRYWAEPLPGMAAAHDVMEHFARDKGTLEDEMMAFGAALHVRGNDYFQRRSGNSSIGINFSGDLCMQTTQYGHTEVRPLHNTKPLEDDLEHEIRMCILHAARELTEREWCGPTILHSQHHESLKGWIRRGYRRACQRYRGISPWMLCESFMLLEDKFEKFLEHAEEGTRCKIALAPNRAWLDFKDLSYDHLD